MDAARRKAELLQAARDCSDRGLLLGAKWSAEHAAAMEATAMTADLLPRLGVDDSLLAEYATYAVAKAYFDAKEYDRCAHSLRSTKSDLCFFLWGYATFLAGEARKEDEVSDVLGLSDDYTRVVNETLHELHNTLAKRAKAGQLDGFGYYLFGICLREQGLKDKAAAKFIQAACLYPAHWGAWQELGALCHRPDDLARYLDGTALPDHWIRPLFDAWLTLELQQNQEAVEQYTALSEEYPSSNHLLSKLALAHYNLRDFDRSEELFELIHKRDPFLLDHIDIYSNILYVKEMKPELSQLAHHVLRVDRYRAETCCVIGNYYSLRNTHDKAVVYFQRALKLNRSYLSAWTLMGHEYVELKNTPAAIEAYRRAVEINPRDYRAWYGLGQTYELLYMPLYSLYYYRQAQKLRPYDARMWSALGNAYKTLNRWNDAVKCYENAVAQNPADYQSIHELALLHKDRLKDTHKAAYYFRLMVEPEDRNPIIEDENTLEAFLFLAQYHKDHNHLATAEKYATFIMRFGGKLKEEAKDLLREIQGVGAAAEAEAADGAGAGSGAAAAAGVPSSAQRGLRTPLTPATSRPEQSDDDMDQSMSPGYF